MKVSTSQKLDWLDAVMADERLDARAKVVAHGIAMHLNLERGDAFVSDRTLADKTGCKSVRTVLDGRNDLRSLGWVDWKRTGSANVYSLLEEQMACVAKRQKRLKKARESSRKHSGRDKQTSADLDTQTSADLERADRQDSAELDRQDAADPDTQTSADIPFSFNPVAITPLKKEKSLAKVSVPSEFDIWWSIYPRRVAKLQALRIYKRIIESCQATSAELLAGAEQYAAQQKGQDPRYVKHPATWLNQGCWQDETAPASQHRNPETRGRADSAVDGMRGYLEDPT